MSEFEVTVYIAWYLCGFIAVLVMFLGDWPTRHPSTIGTILFALLVVSAGPVSLALVFCSLAKR